MKKEIIGKIQVILGIILLVGSVSLIVYNQSNHSTNLDNISQITKSLSKPYNASEMNITKDQYFQTELMGTTVYFNLEGQYRNDYFNLIYFSSIILVLSVMLILQGLANLKK